MSNHYIDWMDKPDLFVKITGKFMDKLSIKFEVGQYPNIKSSLSIKRFLESLEENDLNSLIEFCEMRLKCLKK